MSKVSASRVQASAFALLVAGFLASVAMPAHAVPVTVESRVSSSADDAEESSAGYINLTSTDLDLVLDQANQIVGIRFGNLNIAPGAVITSAYIQFTVDEKNSEATALQIAAQASDNAQTWTTAKFGVSSRAKTAAVVSWSPPAWSVVNQAGLDQRTPELGGLVQEIVNRPGWQSGNSMAFIISGSGRRVARAFNYSLALAPLLHIEYQASNTPPELTITSPADGTSVTGGTALTFTGSATDTDDGDLSAGIAWSSSRDGSLGTGATISPILSVGAHTITASTSDSGGLSASKSISVIVNVAGNSVPQLNIISPADGTSITTGASALNLTGSATDDEDGDLSASLTWSSSRDGSLGTGASIAPNLSIGAHTITASITDSVGQTTSKSIGVTVVSNALPQLNIVSPAAGTSVTTGTALNFTGSATDTEDGDLSAGIAWSSSLDGSLGAGASVSRVLTIGNHTITASITDSFGQTTDKSIGVIVVSNVVPQLSIVSPANGVSITTGTALNFTGSATDTEDGNISAGITWSSSLDGNLGTGASVSPALSVGNHTITASATDSFGQTISKSISVSVTASGGTTLTFDRQIAAGIDDAEENTSGVVTLGSTKLELVTDKTTQIVGLRFGDIGISPGSVVTNAWIQFATASTASGTTNLTLRGQASANAASFGVGAFNVSARPRTAAHVNWTPTAWSLVGAAGAAQRTPDLAPLLNEIINSGSWEHGNAISIIISGSGKRVAQSREGAAGAAPILHVEYVDSGANVRPKVDAGASIAVAIILPTSTLSLDGTVTDDGQPAGGTLTTLWTHQGGTGTGTVSFGNAASIDTTFSVSPDPGTYILRLTASDGNLSAHDELTVIVKPAGAGGQIQSITQINSFETGFVNLTSPLAIPATDPAGITFHSPSGHLIIADSEIDEMSSPFSIVQANLFETPLNGGTTFNQWNTTVLTGNEPKFNFEPTGIAYCENDGHFYVSNDDARLIYRYAYDGFTLKAVDSISVAGYANDPEDITCDPATGRLYVIDGVSGAKNVVVLRYQGGFVVENYFNLPLTAGSTAGVPSDPEGIAFDPGSGHLFVTSSPEKTIYEYTTSGVYIRKFSFGGFSPTSKAGQGLAIGPSSDNPQTTSFYLADGLVDNDSNPNERDGRIYEARINRAP